MLASPARPRLKAERESRWRPALDPSIPSPAAPPRRALSSETPYWCTYCLQNNAGPENDGSVTHAKATACRRQLREAPRRRGAIESRYSFCGAHYVTRGPVPSSLLIFRGRPAVRGRPNGPAPRLDRHPSARSEASEASPVLLGSLVAKDGATPQRAPRGREADRPPERDDPSVDRGRGWTGLGLCQTRTGPGHRSPRARELPDPLQIPENREDGALAFAEL